ncbi:hypothetical protein [Ralstonia pickettii]|uniref:hypothetical protein n=1 Tax=Ralstonia pickettii TaxID=329 RepID=UPI0015BD9CD3|nr:hypothetical protein [Ralstonia pickettii]NWK44912.1 hypothetical protein [Ralstonia pickettii]
MSANILRQRRQSHPPAARFAVVSNPGTLFQRIEDYAPTLAGAKECMSCYDVPVDVMLITPSGALTTEF